MLLENDSDKFSSIRKSSAWFPAKETRAEYNQRSRFVTQRAPSIRYRIQRFRLPPANNARICSKKKKVLDLDLCSSDNI